MSSSVIKKAFAHLKHYGLHDFIYKTLETMYDKKNSHYSWEEYATSAEELDYQRKESFNYAPLISILVPTYETKPLFLVQLLDSIVAQTYGNWELCLADASVADEVEQIVVQYQKSLDAEQAGRIKYKRLESNKGISENTNRAYEMASGEFVGLLDHDDVLAPNALYEMVCAINDMEPEARKCAMLYSDEDKIDETGESHFYPHFKMDFNLEYLRTNNYICHFLVASKELVKAVGGWRQEFDGAQDYDFILRCSEKAASIVHVPKILYHWRVSSTSTAGDKYTKLYAYEAGRKAIEEHLKRCGESGTVTILKELGTYKVNYDMVSVDDGVVPYQTVISEIGKYVTYQSIETINHVTINKEIKTPFVALVNSSVNKKTAEKTLRELIMYMSRSTVAVVAPKVVAGRKVEQNGICRGNDGRMIKKENGLNHKFKGYFKRASLPQNADGIMFECTLMRTSVAKKIDWSRSRDELELSDAIRNMGLELIQASDVIMKSK